MKKLKEELKNDIKLMLKCGQRGADIAYATGVSQSVISKIRKELIMEGFDIWHRGGVISQYIRV